MEQMHLKQKDLTPSIGSVSKVSEILSGKRQLSLTMIRKLHKNLEIPLKSLFGSKKTRETSSLQLDYNQFPVNELQKRGFLGELKRSVKDLKEYCEEIILDFTEGFSDILDNNIVSTPTALLRAPLHRRGKRKLNQYNLAIWQICVLKKAASVDKKLPKFNCKLIDEKWLRTLMKFSQYDHGHLLVEEYLQNVGISFVIEPHFSQTFLDGAALMYKGKPTVALTMRHNRIDNFWFVLAHELAHIMKHINDDESSFFIDDNLEKSEQIDEIEKEADLIANEALIPTKLLMSSNILKASSYSAIEKFAKEAEVNPAIIAGRIRYHKNNFSLFPKLIKPLHF